MQRTGAFHPLMINVNLDIISWNVRGLNQQTKKDAVHQFMKSTLCHLACLQETKLANIDKCTTTYLDGSRLRKHAYKLAGGPLGTRGGILLLWNEDYIEISNITVGEFSIAADVLIRECLQSVRLIVVYGPSRRNKQQRFLSELHRQKPIEPIKWLVVGDFNLIYKASNRNNNNLKSPTHERLQRNA